jgi:hypothetical protein
LASSSSTSSPTSSATRWSPSDLAADPAGPPGTTGPPGLATRGDQRQQGGLPRIEQLGQLADLTVGRVRALAQVVGADAEEVDGASERVGAQRAAGTSAITPAVGSPAARQRSTNTAASAAVATIGAVTYTCGVLSLAASAIAASCRSKTSGQHHAVRGPRTPSAGLGSAARLRNDTSCPRPRRVRRTTRLPAQALPSSARSASPSTPGSAPGFRGAGDHRVVLGQPPKKLILPRGPAISSAC